ncbi:GntR family transcriptional regulator [Halomonas sp. HMF6819]|uniref:GntR family transcriptional regulator n=1 Tax=Halomonas sp. HMF6819 TaxID=3373085 RepID=UPI0037A1F002
MSSRSIKIQRPQSLATLVTERIREAIVSGEFTLGEKISEESLAETFDVSRSPVRDALNALQFTGLVEIRPKRGSFVFNPTILDIGQLCEYREMLEREACTLAMRGSREALLEALKALFDEMASAHKNGDTRRYAALDTAFHKAFFEHCSNALVQDAYLLVEARLATIRTVLTAAKKERREASYDEHGEIIDALKKNDMARFEKVLKTHIHRTQAVAVERLSEPDSGGVYQKPDR